MKLNEASMKENRSGSGTVTVAAVVVTYNRLTLLQQGIDCLLAQKISSDAALDILIIDNASTDGTGEALAGRVEAGEIRYFNTGANLGGAGGFNWGMRQAGQDGYDFMWIMDDDCQPHEDSLQALLDADEALGDAYGFLSSVVRWTDGSICRMNVQRHPLTRDIEDFSKDLQPCTLASFVSLFVPSRVVMDVGLPIKDFFVWSDDWEFTRRISRRYSCYLVGRSIVTHASKVNGKGTIVDCDPARIDRYRLIYRNDVVIYRREGIKGRCYLLARAGHHITQVLLHSPEDKRRKIGIIVRSNLDGARFHPAVEVIDPADVRPVAGQRLTSQEMNVYPQM